mmetsp:Transcript_67770/g.189153  ORF Transcript_67770/g.189153 Transcript_67770/m.189153 type:complete len:205 (+) Transcript_67770:1371-1985(+)
MQSLLLVYILPHEIVVGRWLGLLIIRGWLRLVIRRCPALLVVWRRPLRSRLLRPLHLTSSPRRQKVYLCKRVGHCVDMRLNTRRTGVWRITSRVSRWTTPRRIGSRRRSRRCATTRIWMRRAVVRLLDGGARRSHSTSRASAHYSFDAQCDVVARRIERRVRRLCVSQRTPVTTSRSGSGLGRRRTPSRRRCHLQEGVSTRRRR